jgi:hypothetical protein
MRQFGESPSVSTLETIESSTEKYLAHLRIKQPDITNPIIHSVMVSGIEYRREDDRITGVERVYVANPLNHATLFNARPSYLSNEIDRWDFFKVIQNWSRN